MSTEPHNAASGIGRGALSLILGLMLARVIYLVWFCPYELAADEAQYWDWSRPEHLSLSYYSKGPGIAWLIAASTRMFGNAEGAIRLPAALSTAIAMGAIAALAARMGGRRAAFIAALAFCCIPAYHATSILMTIDAPYIACWAIACLAAWSLRERGSVWAWLALAGALGAGFLFKYTILLLAPGLLVWLLVDRPSVTSKTLVRSGLALLLFAAIISPVIIWNARSGWPTVSHLLGHLNVAGGDGPHSGTPRGYDPRWTLEFLGTQLGLAGPMMILIPVAARDAWRCRAAEPRDWRATCFALATGLPILLFYLCVSFTTDVEGNWPIAGYTTMLIPVALMLVRAQPLHGLRRGLWNWSLGFGAASFLALFALQWLDRVPYLTNAIPYHRLSGHRAYAGRVAEAMPPGSFVIADQYTRAALLAYYLPGQPHVRSATSFLGGRRSSYDFFPDTSLRDPALDGRAALLVGATPEKWLGAFRFDSVEPLLPADGKRAAVYLGYNYAGPASP